MQPQPNNTTVSEDSDVGITTTRNQPPIHGVQDDCRDL
jgi:hypothetical protein